MLPGEIELIFLLLAKTENEKKMEFEKKYFFEQSSCPGETEAMWKKWYEAQGYDTTNWSGGIGIDVRMTCHCDAQKSSN